MQFLLLLAYCKYIQTNLHYASVFVILLDMNTTEHRSDCPINYLLELVGDKWSLLIIRDMLLEDKKTYGEFLASNEKIATNILASRLTSLEKSGLITKKRDLKNGTRHSYSLTDKSLALAPLFLDIMIFSAEYAPFPISEEQMNIAKRGISHREEVIEQIRSGQILH